MNLYIWFEEYGTLTGLNNNGWKISGWKGLDRQMDRWTDKR